MVLQNLLQSSKNWTRGAPAWSVASQVLGLLQLVALLWRTGPSAATDAYFYFFNLGNLPVQVLLVGLYYPLLINESRLSQTGARIFRRATPIAALLVTAAGVMWFWCNDRLSQTVGVVIALCATNSLLQSFLWYRAIAAEAEGDARWVAGVAVPANALAVLTLLLPWNESGQKVTVMLLSLILGNIGLVLFSLRRQVGVAVLRQLPNVYQGQTSAYWWFSLKALASYGGLVAVQSISVILPPAALTLVSIPTKIVGSVATTFVNAVLPRLVNQGSVDSFAADKFHRRLFGATLLVSIPGAIVAVQAFGFPAPVAATVVLWLLAATSVAVAQRLTFRFLKPNASRATLIAVPLVVLLLVLSTQLPEFNLVVVLCAYALIDALTALLLLIALKDRAMAVAVCIVNLLVVGLWLSSAL